MFLERLRPHPATGGVDRGLGGQTHEATGLGLGDGPVVAVLGALILALVAWLAVTKSDVQQPVRADNDHRCESGISATAESGQAPR